MGAYSGGYSAGAIVLVLFVLLAIVFSAGSIY